MTKQVEKLKERIKDLKFLLKTYNDSLQIAHCRNKILQSEIKKYINNEKGIVPRILTAKETIEKWKRKPKFNNKVDYFCLDCSEFKKCKKVMNENCIYRKNADIVVL
jgi:hypothetical protein